MNSKECEEQLESLVEAWQLNEADLNQTDIEAIKHLMLENQIQHNEINKLKHILDELEKYLEKNVKRWEQEEQKWIEHGFMKFGGEANNKIIFKNILNKLKELRGRE